MKYEYLSYHSPSRLHSFLHSRRTNRSDWLFPDNAHFCTGSHHRTILCLQDRFKFSGDQNELEIGFKTLQLILERPRLLPLSWISIFRKTIVKWCCAVGILLPTLNLMQLTEWFDITWHFRLELELTFLSTWHRSSVVAPCSEQYISCESVRGQVSTGNDVN